MATVKAILKSYMDRGKYKIVVFGDKEYVAFDAKLKEYEGKEVELDTWSKADKHYCGFPKQGGFQGKKGGYGGKSDKELYLQALTMSMAYSKDVVIAYFEKLPEASSVFDLIIDGYQKMSKAILADLKAIEGEAPKVAEKPPMSVPQATSAQKAPTDKPKYVPLADDANLTVKQKLEKKAWEYLQNLHSDSDDNFEALLMELTAFTGKDGKEVSCDSLEKLSEKWAGSAYGKLEKLIEEEERKAIAESTDDIPY